MVRLNIKTLLLCVGIGCLLPSSMMAGAEDIEVKDIKIQLTDTISDSGLELPKSLDCIKKITSLENSLNCFTIIEKEKTDVLKKFNAEELEKAKQREMKLIEERAKKLEQEIKAEESNKNTKTPVTAEEKDKEEQRKLFLEKKKQRAEEAKKLLEEKKKQSASK